jgi:hypothetical protein
MRLLLVEDDEMIAGESMGYANRADRIRHRSAIRGHLRPSAAICGRRCLRSGGCSNIRSDRTTARGVRGNVTPVVLGTAHRGVRDPGRKYTPAAIVVLKEEDCTRTVRRVSLDVSVAAPAGWQMPKPDYANPCVRSGRKPFFYQMTQGLLGGMHD